MPRSSACQRPTPNASAESLLSRAPLLPPLFHVDCRRPPQPPRASKRAASHPAPLPRHSPRPVMPPPRPWLLALTRPAFRIDSLLAACLPTCHLPRSSRRVPAPAQCQHPMSTIQWWNASPFVGSVTAANVPHPPGLWFLGSSTTNPNVAAPLLVALEAQDDDDSELVDVKAEIDAESQSDVSAEAC
uniref:Uncharacterized protein n=1 Tax=Mycena chlorophos TaxID=658473 RepID=A0ABQ0LIT0_MYCCL|nr:predicted protein [Mycena chlorophos]